MKERKRPDASPAPIAASSSSAAFAAAEAVAKRESGRFLRSFSQKTSTPAGSDGSWRKREGASSSRILRSVVAGLSVRKGFDPVSASWSITPTEKRSERASRWEAVACSGDMYAGVPMTLPVCVRRVIWLVFEMPKSATFTAPARVTITFCGLTSRWTMPRSWAQASPFSVSAATKRASSGGSLPRLSRTVRSVPPSISSIAR